MSELAVDLSLCSQCWAPYDAEEHQPKLLQCSFHPMATVCLQCLKSEKGCLNDDCDTCRDACAIWSLDDLPLNIYALQLAEWKSANAKAQTNLPQLAGDQEKIKTSFDYRRCPFVFTFSMGEVELGEVHVMTSPLVIQHKFVQTLGEYCFREPKEFLIFGEPQFKPNSFYTLECYHMDFQPLESEVMVFADPSKLAAIVQEELASLDVALEPSFDEDGRLINFRCLFFLKSAATEMEIAIKKSAETIWGKVTRGSSVLEWLANIPEGEHHRRGVKTVVRVTLETRNPTEDSSPS
ncbi:hypothetical protein GHT06_010935 [Daphnia sinensis]|uniref:RING-type domain-containing protein n=1 Tax=Daphnia sinensis TaxID=1820382 RepID=A0AAD5KZS4_9CRUS|nr:hypothetical protein GHT06_010935 [Daphnia sinensis]